MKRKLLLVTVCLLISTLAGCGQPNYAEAYGVADKTHPVVTSVHQTAQWAQK